MDTAAVAAAFVSLPFSQPDPFGWTVTLTALRRLPFLQSVSVASLRQLYDAAEGVDFKEGMDLSAACSGSLAIILQGTAVRRKAYTEADSDKDEDTQKDSGAADKPELKCVDHHHRCMQTA